jgi:hypothetical protein
LEETAFVKALAPEGRDVFKDCKVVRTEKWCKAKPER